MHTAQIFIKTIGIYPPGTVVRLASNEVALVVASRDKGNHSKGATGNPTGIDLAKAGAIFFAALFDCRTVDRRAHWQPLTVISLTELFDHPDRTAQWQYDRTAE